MIDWIKNINKDYPEFWKNYLSKFENQPQRYVALSIDYSGANPQKDVVFAIAAVGIENDKINIGDFFEVVLLQYVYLHENGLSNESIIESKLPKLGEREAIQAFIEYIGNAVLVGYKINLTIDLINAALEKMNCGRLKNDAIDIEIMHKKFKDTSDKSYSLADICEDFKLPIIEEIVIPDLAYTVSLLFLKLKSRLGLK
ncbi:MAG: 3'-5' exonuclease [Flavobacteriaceae bacterium]|jgi:DNA polymerase-3 subunit epsilon|nr:3'-5' exonuclease [Flavobacteriaceae bacterium]